jgi:hypothetical protein
MAQSDPKTAEMRTISPKSDIENLLKPGQLHQHQQLIQPTHTHKRPQKLQFDNKNEQISAIVHKCTLICAER